MRWILVTGGVHSGIGKGCLAASLGRLIARAGAAVEYRKFEPCLQGEIGQMANTHFGEVVENGNGLAYDADVARAAFLIPGFRPTEDSDLSLGRVATRFLKRAFARGEAAPRLGDLSATYAKAVGEPADVLITEIGGTAGEPEHTLVCTLLIRALGKPALHAHLTTEVVSIGGRVSTKPAQVSLDALAARPDLVVVRVASEGSDARREKLRQHCGRGIAVVPVATDDAWPERAYYEALGPGSEGAPLLEAGLGLQLLSDPVFLREDVPRQEAVAVVHDGAGGDGYSSLVSRLRGWSGGRLLLDLRSVQTSGAGFAGLVRVGECPPPGFDGAEGIPTLAIVPEERGLGRRAPAARPDWEGTLDEPSGEVFAFVQHVLRERTKPETIRTDPPLAYAVPAFASRYLEASKSGRLRDHALIDPLAWRALPGPDLLRGARVLDIGCGDGRWAEKLLEAGAAEVVGVEPATPMADGAERRRLSGLRVIRSRIEDAPLEGMFDAVLAYMSLDHVEDLGPVLRRCARHLVPFGRVIVATEHPIRTAPLSGPRWINSGVDSRSSVVRDYASPGWRQYRWFGRSEQVAVYHRPLEAWIDALRCAGLQLVAVQEPSVPVARDGGNPRFWLLAAERPGVPGRVVTVDGAAGSGKSLLGSALAVRLGWIHVDCDKIWRALARLGARGADLGSLVATARGSEVRFFVDDIDISSERTDPALSVGANAGCASREAVAAFDRLLAGLLEQPAVLSGGSMGRARRDALVRIWLDSPTEARATRLKISLDEMLARDASDRARGRLLDPDIDCVRLDSASNAVEDLAGGAAKTVQSKLIRCQTPTATLYGPK